MKKPQRLETRIEPKLITVLREGYTRRLFARDLGAGLIVGVLALPLALAFAIASGVKPEQGLFTAIIGGFLISALSGSRVQIGGPTGAFIVIVYSVVQRFGYDGLAVATILAGALLVVMGLTRMGAVIKFIPYPVTVGFTAGIALIILSSQLRDFLGLTMNSVPADFIQKWSAYAAAISTYNLASVAVGIATDSHSRLLGEDRAQGAEPDRGHCRHHRGRCICFTFRSRPSAAVLARCRTDSRRRTFRTSILPPRGCCSRPRCRLRCWRESNRFSPRW